MKYLSTFALICAFSSITVQAQDAPDLPDLPQTQPAPEAPKALTPETNRILPETRPANTYMPRVTQEQKEKAQKEKNWLTEGLKQKELEAEALREKEALSQQSIIDQILERNQQQISNLNEQSSELGNNQENRKMKAALSTTAWEPLEPIDSSNYNATTLEEGTTTNQTEEYQKFDQETGISNVFFNPTTGRFDSRPIQNNTFQPERPELQKPWIQQETTAVNTVEQKKVEAFEARMIEQARAQNKLPDNYQNTNLSLTNPQSPLVASNTNGSNPALLNPNLLSNQLSPDGPNQSTSSYAASAAKLRMMEEERQRKLEEQNRPSAIDIHSPFQGRGIEINPRF
ncbi:MAG: hypothetical protein AAF571_02160 [Verrucomicrobiota bacterium]